MAAGRADAPGSGSAGGQSQSRRGAGRIERANEAGTTNGAAVVGNVVRHASPNHRRAHRSLPGDGARADSVYGCDRVRSEAPVGAIAWAHRRTGTPDTAAPGETVSSEFPLPNLHRARWERNYPAPRASLRRHRTWGPTVSHTPFDRRWHSAWNVEVMAAVPATQLERQVDRRAGVHDLVRQVAHEWQATQGRVDLQNELIDRLRRLLAIGSVRFNELTGGTTIRPGQPIRTRDYVAFSVPVTDATRRIVLEASVTNARGLDDWTCQLLETAANLAGVLFDTDRLAKLHRGPSAASRRCGAAHRIQRGHERAAGARGARRHHRLHRPRRRRERHGQRARGTANPRVEPAPHRAVRGDQLRGARRDAHRGRAVWHRRAHGHRRPWPARQVRARRRRHVVPRRGVGAVARRSGEAAAGDPGPQRRTCRRLRQPPGQHANRRRQ